MRFYALFAAMLLSGSIAFAQNDDPTIMTINGQPVSRSEFEYSYNKNNSEGVIDKKTVNEYVDLFVNYKLKVLAALDAHIDTTASFKQEFLQYRDQQVRPAMISSGDVEAEAQKIYEEAKQRVSRSGGMVHPAHILIRLGQKASAADQETARQKAQSIYQALCKGGDFAGYARKYSDDQGSAVKGGDISWISRGQTVKTFEDAAFSLKVGEISKPILSEFGYHIIKLMGKQDFYPYDSVKNDILRFIDAKGIRERIINEKLDSIARTLPAGSDRETVLDQKASELSAHDKNLKYLMQEYHDGLLLYEISNRMVWEKAANDEQAQAAYFAKNKKKYRWEHPRFKGIAYHTKDAADVAAVKKCVKGKPFSQWAELLRRIKIYFFTGGFHHSKIMMVDSLYSFVGSANLNSRSLSFDYECNLLVADRYTTGQLQQIFYNDRDHRCFLLTPEIWKYWGTWKKAKCWIFHFLTPFVKCDKKEGDNSGLGEFVLQMPNDKDKKV